MSWCLRVLARNPDSELFAAVEKRQPTNFYQIILKLGCYIQLSHADYSEAVKVIAPYILNQLTNQDYQDSLILLKARYHQIYTDVVC